MSDNEIYNYLNKHNFTVDAQECLMKVLNTSPQIIDSHYDYIASTMTIITPDNIFKFRWVLGTPPEDIIYD